MGLVENYPVREPADGTQRPSSRCTAPRTAAGAAVYDNSGALVAGGVTEDEHDLREHAAAA